MTCATSNNRVFGERHRQLSTSFPIALLFLLEVVEADKLPTPELLLKCRGGAAFPHTPKAFVKFDGNQSRHVSPPLTHSDQAYVAAACALARLPTKIPMFKTRQPFPKSAPTHNSMNYGSANCGIIHPRMPSRPPSHPTLETQAYTYAKDYKPF